MEESTHKRESVKWLNTRWWHQSLNVKHRYILSSVSGGDSTTTTSGFLISFALTLGLGLTGGRGVSLFDERLELFTTLFASSPLVNDEDLVRF